MKFFKKNVYVQQAVVKQARRFTLGQYIAAVSALLLSVTAASYAAGLLTLITFSKDTVISSVDVNANFNSINDQLAAMTATMATMSTSIGNNAVPAGTLVAFAGTTVPAGYKQCPTNLTDAIVSTTVYPALYAAVGSTWGTTSNSTSFVMPWFPEGYSLLQANALTPNVGVQSFGNVISHTHRPVFGGVPSTTAVVNNTSVAGSNGANTGYAGSSVLTIEATGGQANMVAGTKVKILVKL